MGPEPHPSMAGRGNRARLSSSKQTSPHPRQIRWPLITIMVAGACLVLPRWPTAEAFLQYDRTKLLTGEVWRLATCHLGHWSASHQFWSLGAFAVLGLLGETRDRRTFAWCCIAAGLACSLALLVFWPDVQLYRGMSGIDSALFTCVVLLNLRTPDGNKSAARNATLAILLFGFIAKVAWEWLTHRTLFVSIDGKGFVSLPDVHAVGGAVGICVGLLSAPFIQLQDRYN